MGVDPQCAHCGCCASPHELIGDGSVLSAAYSLECGSRLHLQGFIALKAKATLAALRALMGAPWVPAISSRPVTLRRPARTL